MRWFLTRIRSCEFSDPNIFLWLAQSWLPCLKQSYAYSGQTRENPPYKGDWLKICYSQEERNKPEYSKPRISSWVTPSYATLLIEWGKKPYLNRTFDHGCSVEIATPLPAGSDFFHYRPVAIFSLPPLESFLMFRGKYSKCKNVI